LFAVPEITAGVLFDENGRWLQHTPRVKLMKITFNFHINYRTVVWDWQWQE
jgi:hypothetical protein